MLVDSDNDPVLNVAIVATCGVILVVVACVYLLIIHPVQDRRKSLLDSRKSLQTYRGLYGNARRLGLHVCEVNGKCMFAAVADQPSIKCPYGTYSADTLKKRVQSSTVHVESSTSILSQLRQRFKHSVVLNDWQNDVNQLQTLADAIHRVIEIVHDDRRETTVLRPLDMQINESLMVLYIGRCCRGYYYSLRLKNKRVAGKTLDNKSQITDNLSSVDEMEGNNGADKENEVANILSQNNTMIGDNCRQYIFNRSSFNDDGSIVQNNTVHGPGSSQNILVTFTESEPLKQFLQNTSRNFSEDERPNLHLKIRQHSNTLSREQLEREELAVIQSLNSVDSEARIDLDTVLNKFDLSFDKAIQGCILLQLSADFNSSFLHFADEFNHKGLDELMEHIGRYILIDTDTAIIDLELTVDTESEHDVEGSHLISDNKINQVDKQSSDREKRFEGITIVCKPKPRGHDNRSRLEAKASVDIFPQEVAQTVLDSSFISGLIGLTSENNAHFDRYAFDPMVGSLVDYRQEINQNNRNTLIEAMHGLLGIVTTQDGKKGTCFQVGNNYVLTAGHIFCDSDLKRDLYVRFTSEDEKSAQLIYLCEELDFAIVCVYGFVSINKHHQYDMYPCHPGLSLNLMYPGNDRQGMLSIERAIVASNDYMFSKRHSEFVLLEALGELRPGSSGSPGVIFQDGKLYIIAVLIGALTTSHTAYYVCTSMTDIVSHLELIQPQLAKELMISPHTVLRKTISVG